MVSMKRALVLSSCCLLLGATAPPLAAYKASVDTWHSEREARLRAEDGWLTLIGLDWLQPGENTLGSAPDSRVLLPEGTAPAKAGLLVLEPSAVRLRPFPGNGLLLNGMPATESVLKTDVDGNPDVMKAGRVSFYVIRRGDRFGIRLKDPEAPVRKAFRGIPRYPVNPAWRVEAAFVPYDVPKVRVIPTVIGTSDTMSAPGLLHFKVRGRDITLEPMIEDPAEPQLFLIFRDATSGKGSYPAGRFLYADLPKQGKVILDFNRAINPPCAFSHFATCPLPPKQNQLPISIPAGEKDPGLH